MHTYRKNNEGFWTVGFSYDGKFFPLADFDEEWMAAAHTSFLNGGQPSIRALNYLWPKAVAEGLAWP